MRNGTSRDNRTRNRRQLPPVAHLGPFGPCTEEFLARYLPTALGQVDADLAPIAMDRAILLEENPARSFLI
jgi:hypothetical protein